MAEQGFVHFPGRLNPKAQEFKPMVEQGFVHKPTGHLDPMAQEFIPMAEQGFPGHLDPMAQEFIPATNPSITLLQPQIYYLYPYPPYDLHLQFQPMPACNYPAPPAQVSPLPTSPTLPPPSTTPSRTLLLSSVQTDVSESVIRRELEVFGDVRAVQMERVRNGIVTVHFYDLRDSHMALVAIQNQHMQQQYRLKKHYDTVLTRNSYFEPEILGPPLPSPAFGLIAGRPVWAQFMFSVTDCLPEGYNQGTIVIFNLASDVSTGFLRQIFEAFGVIKELRDTPMKRHQKFIEFFDIRDASKAVLNMNGKEINGKQVVIEFSRPGGHNRRFSNPIYNANSSRFNSNANYSGTFRCSPPHLCKTKSNPNSSVEAQMGPLCLNGGNGNGNDRVIEGSGSDRTTQKKSYKKGGQVSSSKAGSNRPWKGSRQSSKEYDPQFLIDEDGVMESNHRDYRTTVMIKNIPNMYSQNLLLNMLDNHCIHCNEQIVDGGEDQPLSSYDFVYLPIDVINKRNLGYGFVNMTSPEATSRLYKSFHNKNWEVYNSRKICEVTYARLQGVEELKEHFKNSKFLSKTEECLPVLFSPPRDGRLLSDPIPIVGRAFLSLDAVTYSSSKYHLEDDDDDQQQLQDEEENSNLINEDADVDVSAGISSYSYGATGSYTDDELEIE